MDWGGGIVCREESFIISEENILKEFIVMKLKDFFNMDKVGSYRIFC